MIIPQEMEEIAFLQNLGEQYRNQIASMAQLRECGEGTVLFRQGQDSSFIYFVLRGKVGLQFEESGTTVEFSTVGPGELLGWSPVLGRHAMTATARTQTPCRLAALEVHRILELCERDPRFGVEFLRQTALVLSERLCDVRRNHAHALRYRPPFTAAAEDSD